jgi:hypothetical protein
VSVAVKDTRADQTLMLLVHDHERALDVFHPYACEASETRVLACWGELEDTLQQGRDRR